MRKKHERKHKKRLEENSPIDEDKLARLEAIKSKREKTIAMVKLHLDDKFNERFAITRANMLKEEHDRQEKLRDESKSLNAKKMIKIREEMKKVMSAGVEKVHAAKILEDKVKFDVKSATMTISGKKYKIKKNVHMIGWGLEALMLGSTFEKIIGDNLKRGWLVVPRRTIARMSIYPEWFPRLNTRIIYSEAGSDSTPDEICFRATKNIVEYCKKLKKKDILIVVLSSSADDLLCLPKGTIGLREKIKLLEQLREAGATTREIDLVRRSLSAVRGGGLARLAYPAKVISLVMSDAGSDDVHLERIAGGPTVNDDVPATISKVQRILEKYGFYAHKLSQSIREVLMSDQQESAPSSVAEQSKMIDENKHFKFVSDFVVASSEEAINAMAVSAFRLGYSPIKLAAAASAGAITVAPNVRKVSKEYTKMVSLLILAAENKITPTEMYEAFKQSKIFDISENKLLEIFPSKDKWARGLYVLIGAPPISENAYNDELASGYKSGKNQELALYFSLYWYLRTEQYPILKEYVVWFLGCASAGRDGNTEHAGAYGYGNLGVDVYRQYKADSLKHPKQSVDPDVSPNGRNMIPTEKKESAQGLEDKRRAIHEAILPDRVLANRNANLLFLNVNEGEELLTIGNAAGYTFTNVGDLHAFRIVRYQCSCDGLCLHHE